MAIVFNNIWFVVLYNRAIDGNIDSIIKNEHGLLVYGHYRYSFVSTEQLIDIPIIRTCKVNTEVGFSCCISTIEKLYNYRVDTPKNPAVLFIDTYGIRDCDLQLAKEACLPESIWGIKTYTFDKLNEVIDKINMIESIG